MGNWKCVLKKWALLHLHCMATSPKCACTIPLGWAIYSWSPASSSRSLTRASYSSTYHAGVDTRPSLWLLVPSRYTDEADLHEVSPLKLAYWLFRSCFMPYLSNAAVSEKNPHIFRPLSDAELVVLFVEWLMACTARCRWDWLTDRQLPPRVNYHVC